MAHDERIATAWLNTIRKGDIVWVLGDLSMGNPAKALELIGKLPGRKRFIWGNHDSGHPMHRNAWNHQRAYQEVFEHTDSFGSRKVYGNQVMLSHFPYEGDHQAQDRYNQWRPVDAGLPLVHGHVHEAWHKRGRMFNVGVDHNPHPVHFEEIAEWVNTLGGTD